jgi:hypothetical protein
MFEGADDIVWHANHDCKDVLELVFMVNKLHVGRIRLALDRFECHMLSGAFNPDTNFVTLDEALGVASVKTGEQWVEKLLENHTVNLWVTGKEIS